MKGKHAECHKVCALWETDHRSRLIFLVSKACLSLCKRFPSEDSAIVDLEICPKSAHKIASERFWRKADSITNQFNSTKGNRHQLLIASCHHYLENERLSKTVPLCATKVTWWFATSNYRLRAVPWQACCWW